MLCTDWNKQRRRQSKSNSSDSSKTKSRDFPAPTGSWRSFYAFSLGFSLSGNVWRAFVEFILIFSWGKHVATPLAFSPLCLLPPLILSLSLSLFISSTRSRSIRALGLYEFEQRHLKNTLNLFSLLFSIRSALYQHYAPPFRSPALFINSRCFFEILFIFILCFLCGSLWLLWGLVRAKSETKIKKKKETTFNWIMPKRPLASACYCCGCCCSCFSSGALASTTPATVIIQINI